MTKCEIGDGVRYSVMPHLSNNYVEPIADMFYGGYLFREPRVFAVEIPLYCQISDSFDLKLLQYEIFSM